MRARQAGGGQLRDEMAFPMRRGRQRTHWIAYRKGLPVSVGSEPGFPLERAYACLAGRGGRAVTV